MLLLNDTHYTAAALLLTTADDDSNYWAGVKVGVILKQTPDHTGVLNFTTVTFDSAAIPIEPTNGSVAAAPSLRTTVTHSLSFLTTTVQPWIILI